MAQLRRNFRATLYHLRQPLNGRKWVRFGNGRYAFNRSSVRVKRAEFSPCTP